MNIKDKQLGGWDSESFIHSSSSSPPLKKEKRENIHISKIHPLQSTHPFYHCNRPSHSFHVLAFMVDHPLILSLLLHSPTTDKLLAFLATWPLTDPTAICIHNVITHYWHKLQKNDPWNGPWQPRIVGDPCGVLIQRPPGHCLWLGCDRAVHKSQSL